MAAKKVDLKKTGKTRIFILSSKIMLNSIKSYLRKCRGIDRISCLDDINSVNLIENEGKDSIYIFLEESNLKGNLKSTLKLIEKSSGTLNFFIIYQGIEAQRIYLFIKAGVKGFINPDWSEKEFIRAFNIAQAGEFVFSRKIIKDIIQSIADKRILDWNRFGLSKKESEIAIFITEGSTNKEIAKKLNIAEKTVKIHITHIYAKIACTNRAEAVRKLLLPDEI